MKKHRRHRRSKKNPSDWKRTFQTGNLLLAATDPRRKEPEGDGPFHNPPRDAESLRFDNRHGDGIAVGAGPHDSHLTHEQGGTCLQECDVRVDHDMVDGPTVSQELSHSHDRSDALHNAGIENGGGIKYSHVNISYREDCVYSHFGEDNHIDDGIIAGSCLPAVEGEVPGQAQDVEPKQQEYEEQHDRRLDELHFLNACAYSDAENDNGTTKIADCGNKTLRPHCDGVALNNSTPVVEYFEYTHSTCPMEYSVDSQLSMAIRIAKECKRRLRREVLIALMTLYGKVKYTLNQYNYLNFLLMDRDEEDPLPSHSTIRQSVLPFLLKHRFVASKIKTFDGSEHLRHMFTQAADDENNFSSVSIQRKKQAVVVLPSSWAVSDVSFLPVFDDLFCSPGDCSCELSSSNDTELTIERAPIVGNPSMAFNRCRSFWIRNGDVPRQANIGDVVEFTTDYSPYLLRQLRMGGWVTRMKSGTLKMCCQARVSAVYCANTRKSGTADWLQGGLAALSNYERQVFSFLRSHVVHDRANLSTSTYSEELRFYPGDVFAFLRPTVLDRDFPHDTAAIFVASFWRSDSLIRPNTVLWFSSGGKQPFSTSVPSGVPNLIEKSSFAANHDNRQDICRTTGLLHDRTPFYIYRVLLYADDFNPRSTLFPKGSVGGCYMVPVGMSIRRRRSTCSVRTISLTPTGVSTNLVLDELIGDFVHGATEGFAAVDAYGRRCTVFIDCIGFVADYPASSGVLDVMSHTAHTPCTHCTFRRRQSGSGSSYAYTTEAHSGNSSFVRGLFRTRALRAARINTTECNFLGMRAGDLDEIHKPGLWPLLKLSDALHSARQNEIGGTVQNPAAHLFDAYSRTVIAPDHLITGLAKNLMDCTFAEIRDNSHRSKLDLSLRKAICNMGFDGNTSLYNERKRTMQNVSMSTRYCLLLIFPVVLERLSYEEGLICFSLFRWLRNLSALIFWWPSKLTDGVDAVKLVHGNDKDIYHAKILDLAKKYIHGVHDVCTKKPYLRKYLDKPNVHRLLELAIHTIPLFSHALFVSEMTLESAHQAPKAGLSRSNYPNAHIYAVNLVLVKDWLTRVTKLWNIFTRDMEKRGSAQFGLMRLFGGKDVTKIDWSNERLQDAKKQFWHIIENSLQGNVGNMLEEWYGEGTDSWDTNGRWTADHSKSNRREAFGTVCPPIILEQSEVLLTRCFGGISHQEQPLSVLQHAIFRRLGVNRNSTKYSQHSIVLGDVIEVLIETWTSACRVLQPSRNGRGKRVIAAIGAMFEWSTKRSDGETDEIIWAVVTPFSLVREPDIFHVNAIDKSNFLLIPLSSNVRKVFVLHACHIDKTCTLQPSKGVVRHSETTLEGGNFFLITKEQGYPPRRA